MYSLLEGAMFWEKGFHKAYNRWSWLKPLKSGVAWEHAFD
jgi:hypothetical protein